MTQPPERKAHGGPKRPGSVVCSGRGAGRQGGVRSFEAYLLFCYLKEKCLVVAGVQKEEQSSVSFKGHERTFVAQSRLQVTWLLSENRDSLSCVGARGHAVGRGAGPKVISGFPSRPRWVHWGNSHVPSSGPEEILGIATLVFYSKVGELIWAGGVLLVLRFCGPWMAG